MASGVRAEQLGVICLYRAQADLVKQTLADGGVGGGVAVSTVDAFQGAERDIILVSCCRTTRSERALAFVSSPHRLNVTITRARHHLLLLGSAASLLSNPCWATLLNVASGVPPHFLAGACVPGLSEVAEQAGESGSAPSKQVQPTGSIDLLGLVEDDDASSQDAAVAAEDDAPGVDPCQPSGDVGLTAPVLSRVEDLTSQAMELLDWA